MLNVRNALPVCSITQEIPEIPVTLYFQGGHSTYECSALIEAFNHQIDKWCISYHYHFDRFKFQDPLSRTPLPYEIKIGSNRRPELPTLQVNEELKKVIAAVQQAAKTPSDKNAPEEKHQNEADELISLRKKCAEYEKNLKESYNHVLLLQRRIASLTSSQSNHPPMQNPQNLLQREQEEMAAIMAQIETLERRAQEEVTANRRRAEAERERLHQQQQQQKQNSQMAQQYFLNVKALLVSEETANTVIIKLTDILSLSLPDEDKNTVLLEANTLLAHAYLFKRQVEKAKIPLQKALRLRTTLAPHLSIPFSPEARFCSADYVRIARLDVVKAEFDLYNQCFPTQEVVVHLENAIAIFNHYQTEYPEYKSEYKQALILAGITYLKDPATQQKAELKLKEAASILDGKEYPLLRAGLGQLHHQRSRELKEKLSHNEAKQEDTFETQQAAWASAQEEFEKVLFEYNNNRHGNTLAFLLASHGLLSNADSAQTGLDKQQNLDKFTQIIEHYLPHDQSDMSKKIGENFLHLNYPLIVWTRMQRGRIYWVQNQFHKALADFTCFIDLFLGERGQYNDRLYYFSPASQDIFALYTRLRAEFSDLFENESDAQRTARLTQAAKDARTLTDAYLNNKFHTPSDEAARHAGSALAAAELHLGHAQEALRIYYKLTREYNVNRYSGRAEAHLALGHIAQCINDCKKALAYSIQDYPHEHHYKVAARQTLCKAVKRMLSQQGQVDAAIKALQEARYTDWPKNHSSYEDAHAYLVFAYLKKEDIKQAGVAYKQLCDITPVSTVLPTGKKSVRQEACNYLIRCGDALADKGYYSYMSELHQILRLTPPEEKTAAKLDVIINSQKLKGACKVENIQEAFDSLKELIQMKEVQPIHLSCMIEMAGCYFDASNLTEVMRITNAVLDLDAANQEALELRAEAARLLYRSGPEYSGIALKDYQLLYDLAKEKNDTTKLIYCSGQLAIHGFRTQLLEDVKIVEYIEYVLNNSSDPTKIPLTLYAYHAAAASRLPDCDLAACLANANIAYENALGNQKIALGYFVGEILCKQRHFLKAKPYFEAIENNVEANFLLEPGQNAKQLTVVKDALPSVQLNSLFADTSAACSEFKGGELPKNMPSLT